MGFFDKKIKEYSSVSQGNIINSIEIFKKVLLKQPGYDFLRENQTSFLKQWENQRDERDIIGIMDTGSGKTLVGLLMLYSKLQEEVGPVIYLCPDKHLVKQVCEQANMYGIQVCQFEETDGRQEFPLEFVNMEAILVTTFEKLFNGKSVFGVIGNSRPIQDIGALLIDDAHECVKKARQKSSIKINKSNNEELYNAIGNLFYDDLEFQGRAALRSIIDGEVSVIKQIPYWEWRNKLSNIISLLNDNNNIKNSDIFFNSNLILDDLENSECFISGNSIEITPLSIPFYKIPSFDKAKHRYILSATLNNSFSLVADLGIDKNATINPIKVDTVSLGERLILTPKRYNKEITDKEIREFCFEYSRSANVVVIVPDENKAKVWIEMGAEQITSENITEEISRLKMQLKGNVSVILNRYDGIDLINDACRLLVLDGIPTKESLKEKIEMQYREDSLLVNMKKAQTIEQGLGRAVRSGTDHCVVILMSNDLLSFIGRNSNKRLFTPIVQAQIEFGVNLTENEEVSDKLTALGIIKEAIDECLNSNDNWRTLHKQIVNSAEEHYYMDEFNQIIELADIENKVFAAKRMGNLASIDENMREILKLVSGTKDEGWYSQIYAHLLHSIDASRAGDLQLRAKELNSSLLKPLNFVKGKKVRKVDNQVVKFKESILEFERGTDLVIYINTILSNMIYSPDVSYKDFEGSIKKLGAFLGFESTQPDNEENDGPDNFWRGENYDFIIECKNNSLNDISRDEANQMTASIRWYKEIYTDSERMIGVILHKSYKVANDAHINGEFSVIDLEKLNLLKDNLKRLSSELSYKSPDSWTNSELQEKLRSYCLTESTFIKKYIKNIRR